MVYPSINIAGLSRLSAFNNKTNLGVDQKAEPHPYTMSGTPWVIASNCADYDHFPLISLELLYRAHLDLVHLNVLALRRTESPGKALSNMLHL